MSVIAAIFEAAAQSCERNGYAPPLLQLPSCMYRAAFNEARAVLGYAEGMYTSSFMLGNVLVQDAMDGT